MTYLKRAMMEHPDMDPKALVLFHCPFDFDLPLAACPDSRFGPPSAVGAAALGGPKAFPAHGEGGPLAVDEVPSAAGDGGEKQSITTPALCYLCWNLEVPE